MAMSVIATVVKEGPESLADNLEIDFVPGQRQHLLSLLHAQVRGLEEPLATELVIEEVGPLLRIGGHRRSGVRGLTPQIPSGFASERNSERSS